MRLSIIFLLVAMLVLAAITVVGSGFDYYEIHNLLGRIGLSLVVGLLLLSSVNFLLRTMRWLWFTQRLGLRVPWKSSAVYYIAGFSMGVTPGRMGELIRLWMIRSSHGIGYHRTFPLVVGDRVNDLLVIIALTLGAGMTVDSKSYMIIFIALTLVLVVSLMLRYPWPLIQMIDCLYALIRRWDRTFASARHTLQAGREIFSLPNASIASLLSVAAWFAECLAFFLVLSALSTNIPLDTATFIYSFATLVGALSLLPGGLGGFEAAAVVLLGAHGVDLGEAVLAISIIRLTTLWYSVAIGGLVLSYFLLLMSRKY